MRISLLIHKILIGTICHMAKGYYPRGPAAASLNMTDGHVYQGSTSPAKLYSHPLKNLCDYRKSYSAQPGQAKEKLTVLTC